MTDTDTQATDETDTAPTTTAQKYRPLTVMAVWLAATGVGVLVSYAALRHSGTPWGWIGLCAGLVWLAMARWHHARWLRIALANAGGVALVIAVVEYALMTQDPKTGPGTPVAVNTYTDGYYDSHKDLGYRPLPGIWPTTLTVDGAEEYAVDYTIGDDNLRVIKAATREIAPTATRVVIAGGSFAFGEGLTDEETIAWRLAERGGAEISVSNLAFHGYGPHQILAALETGYLRDRIGKGPVTMVLITKHDHPMRAAGRASWDLHGPRYEVGSDGFAQRHGNFDDGTYGDVIPPRVRQVIATSRIVRQLQSTNRVKPEVDFARYAAILRSMDRELRRQFGDESRLHIWIWSYSDDHAAWCQGIDREALDVTLLHEAIPAADPETFRLSPLDNHPSPLATEKVAAELYRRLVGGATPQDLGNN